MFYLKKSCVPEQEGNVNLRTYGLWCLMMNFPQFHSLGNAQYPQGKPGERTIYVLNQVSLRSILSGAPIFEMRCTIYVQFWGIGPSIMNGTVENSSSNTT